MKARRKARVVKETTETVVLTLRRINHATLQPQFNSRHVTRKHQSLSSLTFRAFRFHNSFSVQTWRRETAPSEISRSRFSADAAESDPTTERNRRKRRNRASRRKKKLLDRSESFDQHSAPFHDGRTCNGFELDANSYCAGGGSVVYEEVREESVCAVAAAREEEGEASTAMHGGIEGFTFGELRQRNVSGASEDLTAASVAHDEGGTGKEDGGGVSATSPVEKAMAAMHNRLSEAIIDYGPHIIDYVGKHNRLCVFPVEPPSTSDHRRCCCPPTTPETHHVSLCHGVLHVVLPSPMQPPYLGAYQRPEFARQFLQPSLYDSVELQKLSTSFVGALTRER